MPRKLWYAMAIALFFLAGVLAGIWILLARPAPRWGSTAKPAAVTLDPEQLRQNVEKLSVEFFPRSHANVANLNRVADYIENHFKAAGAKVHNQVFQAGGYDYRNVIAEFGPDSDGVIVVGAHYDSAGERPAADDNASGVAGLLALARLLGGTQLHRKVMLVGFCLEEPPYFNTAQMGSAVFSKSLADAKMDVRIMICLEMIGYFSDAPGSQAYPISLLKLFYPNKGNFIAVVDQLFSSRAREMKKIMRANSRIPVHSINAPAGIPGIDLSDHKSFWDRGYPAVMITDTAFFRNTAYHTAADTADRLDYARMAQVVNGVFAYVRKIGTH